MEGREQEGDAEREKKFVIVYKYEVDAVKRGDENFYFFTKRGRMNNPHIF